jgi:hypothetical protein
LRNDRVRFIVRGASVLSKENPPIKLLCPVAYDHYVNAPNAVITTKRGVTVIRLGERQVRPARDLKIFSLLRWPTITWELDPRNWRGGVDYGIYVYPKPVWGHCEPALEPKEPEARFYVRYDQAGPWSEANTIPVFHA